MSVDKKLFISYSRRQDEWAKAFYLALFQSGRYFPWIDERIPASVDWWRNICQNIETAYAFVAVFTPTYGQSMYCIAELQYALALNKPIIVLKTEGIPYPQELDTQRIQFLTVGELNTDIMSRTIADIHATIQQVIEDYHAGLYVTPANVPRPNVPTAQNDDDKVIGNALKDLSQQVSVDTPSPKELLKQYYVHKKDGNYDTALQHLNDIRQQGLPVPFNFDEEWDELSELRQAKIRHHIEQTQLQNAQARYDALEIIVEYETPEKRRKAIADFFTQFPDFADIKAYRQQLQAPPLAEAEQRVRDVLGEPFAWCAIEGGQVTIEINAKDQRTYTVAPFAMAKFAITNQQFQVFAQARDGWMNPRWWEFSADAERWQRDSKRPYQTSFMGDLLPRTNVTWYECVAFTRWLSSQTALNITLPTEAQWQRASQGDTNFIYPWGNTFEASQLCWSKNSEKKPVAVTEHAEGASPYGVVQMAGNVWEWCLTEWDDPAQAGLSHYAGRAMRGGSWYNVNADYFRVKGRGGNKPDNYKNNWGLRIILL